MDKPKRFKEKFAVYRVIEGIGGIRFKTEDFIGETLAVSEKQAINNVRFRNSEPGFPNGGPAEMVGGSWLAGEKMYYRAERI